MIPACSIVIPAFNAEKFICEAIDSVLAQECNFDFEIIVVDDGSTDNTSALVSNLYRDQVRLIRKANSGPGSARNIAASAARSDILVMLDADDRMLTGRLSHQVGFMFDNPIVALTWGNLLFQNNPERNANLENGLDDSEDYKFVHRAYQMLIVQHNYIQNGAASIRRSAYLSCGGMDEDIYFAEDYALNCRICLRHTIAYTSRKLTWCRREGHGNLMASEHRYLGDRKVLYDNLLLHADGLTSEEYKAALARFRKGVTVLIRYEWAFNGRKAMKMRIAQFGPLLTNWFVAKWLLISLLPSSFGRLVKRLLNSMNLTFDALRSPQLGLQWIRLRGYATAKDKENKVGSSRAKRTL